MAQQNSAARKTPEEIAEAIGALSPADWVRLRKVARLYAGRAGMTVEDLLQEAQTRALEGARTCPADVDVVRFLAEAMRSIADSERKKLTRQIALVAVPNHGEGTLDPHDPPDPSASVEEHLVERALRAKLLAAVKDDLEAEMLLGGMMEGMRGKALRDLVGLDDVAYESKRKFVWRRIEPILAEAKKS